MMNNRWTELAEECWDEHLIDGWHFDQEKFAKLLIEECLDQCYNRGLNSPIYEGQLKAARYIEEHFGIKK